MRRLERRRRRPAGDVVLDLVERVADRELGGDLGDRKAGRLRGQRRRARHARVHLDHHEPPVGRIDRELHVRAAGLNPDLAQHRDRGVAHDLIFLVGERQRRRHRDRVAGMHAHRIDVFDRADDDAIVVLVAHHLHLVLLPAQHRFFDQHFAGRGGVDAALDDLDEFLFVVGDAAAGAAERERGPDDGRQPDIVERLQGLDQRLYLMRSRRREADLLHRLAEQLAVFGLVDGFGGRADHLHVVLFQHAHAPQRQRGVERGLPAHGRQQRKAAGNRIAFLGDDLGDDLRRDRLDISRVRQIRIGHDGRRIGIDQNDPIALGLQRLARLRARIIKFAGLADNDRPGADDQDRGDVGPLGHIFRSVTRHSGARALAREPGIHIHRWWLWIPGPAFGRPGMTGRTKKGRASRASLSRRRGSAPRGGSLDEKCGRGKGCRRRSAQEPSGA